MQRLAKFYCQQNMKQKLAAIFGFFLVLLLAGCKKNSEPSQSLTGTWELRELQGGMMPAITYDAGNGNRLIFSTDTYQKLQNNALVSSGNYSIASDDSVEQSVGLVVPKGEFRQRINFGNTTKTFFQITGGQLRLLSGYFPTDGGVSAIYERISD